MENGTKATMRVMIFPELGFVFYKPLSKVNQSTYLVLAMDFWHLKSFQMNSTHEIVIKLFEN